ncbi:MAG TPA: hypothetical protein VHA09_01415 [Nitrososphaera sp.]|nr:hypothetical protein [Nitrososphaera sp.]
MLDGSFSQKNLSLKIWALWCNVTDNVAKFVDWSELMGKEARGVIDEVYLDEEVLEIGKSYSDENGAPRYKHFLHSKILGTTL